MDITADDALGRRDRAGAASRRLGRDRAIALLRTHWWVLALLSATVWLAATPALLTTESDHWRGFVLGVTATVSLALPAWSLAVFAGLGSTVAGDVAEKWTADVLRVMSEQGWRIAHHVRDADDREIDHVLVGPGGVLVVETKWSSYDWGLHHKTFRGAVGQVDARARALKRTLALDVVPVLVLWGRAGTALTGTSGAIDVTGVKVFDGQSLERWLLGRSRAVLTQDAQDRAWQTITELAERGDSKHGAAPRPLPQETVRLVRAVVVGVLAFGLPAYAAKFNVAAWLAATAGSAVLGLLVRRNGLRLDGLAVMAGSLGGAAVCLSVALLSL